MTIPHQAAHVVSPARHKLRGRIPLQPERVEFNPASGRLESGNQFCVAGITIRAA
jgi:hypothetical protein